jgi:dihydrofolate reductase
VSGRTNEAAPAGPASPEVVYYVASSLDGFIATADGSVAWLAPFEASVEDYGYAEFLTGVDGLLFGRRTYEQSLTFGPWPYAGTPAWVFSHARVEAMPDVRVTDRTPAEVVAEASTLGLRRLWLVGGGALARSFLEAGLIDEYIISLIPVVLGGGVPIFAAPGRQERLRLVAETTFHDGVVQVHYSAR